VRTIVEMASDEEIPDAVQAGASNTAVDKGKAPKRPYKRKLTEKRRLQNRAAQRTYRE
jgi:hypothetical protein